MTNFLYKSCGEGESLGHHMDSSSSSTLSQALYYCCLLLVLIVLSTSTRSCDAGCYTSIFSFGDSLTDTGNLVELSPPDHLPSVAFPPYGRTYFNRPTGRSSDGRLIVDFIADYLGLPFVPPYWGPKNNTNFRQGANFAVVGAQALGSDFYAERGVLNVFANDSLQVQLGWFKDMLPSLCSSPSSGCKEFLQTALFLVGEFGGNDYVHSVESGISLEEIRTFVPSVVNAITSAINELIELGASTVMAPSLPSLGCSVALLTLFQGLKQEEYDPETGCLVSLDDLTMYHNKLLQEELDRIRELHPRATIIFADYYTAGLPLVLSPSKYGFVGGALRACCGGGGPYNYNSSLVCGHPSVTSCENPSLYVNWDGYHLTEAAYRWISEGILEGPYTIPRIKFSCLSVA